MSTNSPQNDRRSALVPIVAVACIALVVGVVVALLADASTAWRLFGVGPLWPSFADLRNVLAGLECTRRGYDVLVENHCDPWWRPMNYPSIWLALTATGLNSRATVPLALILDGAFVATALFVLRAVPRNRWGVAAAVMISPPVCLLLNRANTDALMFVLVVVALRFARSPRAAGTIGAWTALSLAAVLKLFPIFAIAAAVRAPSRRRTVLAAFATLTPFAIYCYFIRSDLAAIARALPRHADVSYGREVLSMRLVTGLQRLAVPIAPGDLVWLGPGFALASILAAIVVAGRLEEPARCDDEIDLLAGAGLFVGTLFFGHNFIYRLVVLLLCVPTLCRWSGESSRIGALSRGSLVLLLIGFWGNTYAPIVLFTTFQTAVTLLVDQWALWALSTLLLAFCIRIARREFGAPRVSS